MLAKKNNNFALRELQKLSEWQPRQQIKIEKQNIKKGKQSRTTVTTTNNSNWQLNSGQNNNEIVLCLCVCLCLEVCSPQTDKTAHLFSLLEEMPLIFPCKLAKVSMRVWGVNWIKANKQQKWAELLVVLK